MLSDRNDAPNLVPIDSSCCFPIARNTSISLVHYLFSHTSIPHSKASITMSDRSRSGSEEGEGEAIRPFGEDHDSSEESEDDPEEAKRIAEGFIVDNDDDDDEEEETDAKPLTKEERRKKRKEAKRRKRAEREARRKEQLELSDDELDLLNENQGLGTSRPTKRAKRDDGVGEGGLPRLQDIFADDEARLGEDEDDDDLGDFIEESEEEEGEDGESEEQRRERKRQEKLKRREAKKAKPDAAGVDKVWVCSVHLAGFC